MDKEEEKANEDVAAIVDVKEEGGSEVAGEAGGESKEHEIVKGGSPDDDNNASTTEEEQEHAPNSKLRVTDPDEDTYVYRDFSAIPPPTISEVGSLHPQSLQAQKLPAKLASMLADPGKLSTHIISILRKDSTAHPQPLPRAHCCCFHTRVSSSIHKRVDFCHPMVAARAELEGP